MTTSTPTTASTRTARPQWVRAINPVLRLHLRTGLWLWTIIVVAGIATLTVVNAIDEVDFSFFQYAHQGSLWFPFALGIILATVFLTTHLASGMTRRAFVQATVLGAVVSSAAYAILSASAVGVEKVAYDAMGWNHALNPEMFAPGAGFGTVLWWTFWGYLPTQLSGLLVGLCYYRWGAIRGTLSLPLALLPVILINFAGITRGEWRPLGIESQTPAVVVSLIVAAIVAATVAANYFVARRVSIRSIPTG